MLVTPIRPYGATPLKQRFRGGDEAESILPSKQPAQKRGAAASSPAASPTTADAQDGTVSLTPTNSPPTPKRQDLIKEVFDQVPSLDVDEPTRIIVRIPKTASGDFDLEALAQELGIPVERLQFNGALQYDYDTVDVKHYGHEGESDFSLDLTDEYDNALLDKEYGWAKDQMVMANDRDHEFFDFEILPEDDGTSTFVFDTLTELDGDELNAIIDAYGSGGDNDGETVFTTDDAGNVLINAMHLHPSFL